MRLGQIQHQAGELLVAQQEMGAGRGAAAVDDRPGFQGFSAIELRRAGFQGSHLGVQPQPVPQGLPHLFVEMRRIGGAIARGKPPPPVGEAHFVGRPAPGDERRHPVHLLRFQVRGKERPGMAAAQTRPLLQHQQPKVWAALLEAEGAQAAGQPAAGEDQVKGHRKPRRPGTERLGEAGGRILGPLGIQPQPPLREALPDPRQPADQRKGQPERPGQNQRLVGPYRQ